MGSVRIVCNDVDRAEEVVRAMTEVSTLDADESIYVRVKGYGQWTTVDPVRPIAPGPRGFQIHTIHDGMVVGSIDEEELSLRPDVQSFIIVSLSQNG